ncbi:MAG TPA: type II toxin-antitoxin system RelE/ParE family toxin [Burkholderiales bacterium]
MYRAEIIPSVAEVLRHLPPDLKRAVKSSIRAVGADPAIGEPLRGELKGHFKVGVRRYRIVYRIDRKARAVVVVAVGHRRSVYEELADLQRQGAKP